MVASAFFFVCLYSFVVRFLLFYLCILIFENLHCFVVLFFQFLKLFSYSVFHSFSVWCEFWFSICSKWFVYFNYNQLSLTLSLISICKCEFSFFLFIFNWKYLTTKSISYSWNRLAHLLNNLSQVHGNRFVYLTLMQHCDFQLIRLNIYSSMTLVVFPQRQNKWNKKSKQTNKFVGHRLRSLSPFLISLNASDNNDMKIVYSSMLIKHSANTERKLSQT